MSLAVTSAKSVRAAIPSRAGFAGVSGGQAPRRRSRVGIFPGNELIENVGLSLAYSALPMRTFL